MDVPSLKETHPQKYYFKIICRITYYLGMGDIWYEEIPVSYYAKKFYVLWQIIANSYVFLVLIDEFLSYLRSDLSDREKNDLVQFSLAHPTLAFKIVTLYASKNSIRMVMKHLLEETRPIFHSLELEKTSVKQFTKYCMTLVGCSYITLTSQTIEGIRIYVKEDVPIRTEVVYFPNPSHTGFTINVIRFFVEFHWYFIVAMMAAVDCLALCSLLTVGHKFSLLRLYFENMRIKALENRKKPHINFEEEFKKDFVIGIKLHADALWCARNVQKSMGPLYSIQVYEGVVCLVVCLIKLVVTERNLVFLLANLTFIVCMIILTGAYMIPAGDVTHEASLVSTAMFHSGWELCGGTGLRALAVVALQVSQVPVYMTAYGVIVMSHRNLVSLVRSSYSFFAVMY